MKSVHSRISLHLGGGDSENDDVQKQLREYGSEDDVQEQLGYY